jgi:hypothetical protein
METALSLAAVTVRVAPAVMDPEVIVIVVEPGATAGATFPTMVATPGLLECHVPGIGVGVGLLEDVATAEKVTVMPTVATGAVC